MPTADSSLKDSTPYLTDEEREYLMVVAYTFLCHDKWEKAWAIYEVLDMLAPYDLQVTKGLALTGLETGKLHQALARAERWLQEASSAEEVETARMVQARILWALGRREEARESLTGGDRKR